MAEAFNVCIVDVHQLAAIVRNRIDNALIIDSRSFLEFNTSHVINAINVCCSKIVKRRLQQDKITVKELLSHTCQWEVDEGCDVVVYDQGSQDADFLPPDSFLAVLLEKLVPVFNSVNIVQGGFLEFQAAYPNLCEDKTRKYAPLTSLSQPCLPISNHGPTRILPFLYLGSQHDALNKEVLQDHNITYELNVSTSCPKPEFIQEGHFMRIPVNDNYSEKLLPHFPKAFQFLDKVQESGGCVLVHCLAGISRSATVAIAYVMRHLKMSSDDAYRYVKSKRATISPNFNFLGQLLEYEKQLHKDKILNHEMEITTAPVLGAWSSYCQSFKNPHFVCSDAVELAASCLVGKKEEDNFALCRSQSCSGDWLAINEATAMETSGIALAESKSWISEMASSYSNKEVEIPRDKICTEKESHLEKVEWNIKCIPISSLKELNFTPCQASTLSVSESTICSGKCPTSELIPQTVSASFDETNQNNGASKEVKTEAVTENEFKTKFDFALFDSILSECKIETYKTLSSLSQDLSSIREIPISPGSELHAFEFDSKEYNRSDSVSTSGLGSESSDCPDSWNDYHNSSERETDILMDDDYATAQMDDDELQRRKMLGFLDIYGETLYQNYDADSHFISTQIESPLSPSEKHFLEDFSEDIDNTQGDYGVKDIQMCHEESARSVERTLNESCLLVKQSSDSDKHIGKTDGLYRAQSCPGILTSDSMSRTSSLDRLLAAGATCVRRTRMANAERADKCRNRYSCSSLDYMEFSSHVGFAHDSCPDVLHFTTSKPSPSSSLSPSHRTFRHSMIQVS